MPISTGGLISGSLEHLRRPLARNIKEGQNVLVLSDTEHDPRVWQTVLTILADLKAEAALALFSRRPADDYDPPPTICEAMLRSKVNVLVASTGMLHCAANMKAMAAGVPCLCLDGGMQLEWLQSGAITEDIRQMAVRKHYVAKDVFGEGAKICRVTSRYGTDFTYNVEGKIWTPPLPPAEFDPHKIVNYGTEDNRKGTRLVTFLYPTGEFNVAPNDGTGNGKLVIDLTMHHLGRLNSPIELTIKNGRIIQIDGGADARILRDFLGTYGDENAYMCPDASVGVNAKAVVRGCQREDKNIIGAMHFGLGTNIDVGGTIMSNIHMDGVILEPTLYVDGEKRIEHGRFLVPIEG